MNIKNINGALFAMTLVAASAGFTSCEDEPDKYEVAGGTPTIDYVRPVDAASKDSLLTGASLNNTICIVGRNLRSVTKINFNDQSAVLNTSYMTDNTIIVTVPKAIPNEVSDKIYFITNKQDTVAYDFKTIVPAPTINSMSNEWAAPGEEVTIKGDYFLDYDNSHLTIKVGDNYTIPCEDLKISQNSIRFNMPEDMPKHEPITITTINGTTKAGFRYMDNRGILFDFDNMTVGGTESGKFKHGWHATTMANDETSLSGNYIQLGNGSSTMDSKTWDEGNFAFEYWAGEWNGTFNGQDRKLNDIADFSDWSNKSLKFEMCIPKDYPWQAGPMQIMFAGIDKVSNRDGNQFTAGANNNWYQNPQEWPRAIYMPWNNNDGSYDTDGKWITVTIPFTDFIYRCDGNKATSSFGSVEDFASITFFVWKGAIKDASVLPDGIKCTPIIKIDNIRVVPNK